MSKMLCAAVAALAIGGLAQQALAAEQTDAPVQNVRTAGVDFHDRAQVQDFYVRLSQAATVVCDTYGARGRVTQADVACANKTLGDAVRKMDRPLLTAMYEGGRSDRVLAARATTQPQ